MRTILLLVIALAALTLAPACPPPPVPPDPGSVDASAPPGPDAAPMPPQDASPAPSATDAGSDACARACANLKALGCQEGSDIVACASSCRAADGHLVAHPTILCWGTKKTVSDARACGSLACTAK